MDEEEADQSKSSLDFGEKPSFLPKPPEKKPSLPSLTTRRMLRKLEYDAV